VHGGLGSKRKVGLLRIVLGFVRANTGWLSEERFEFIPIKSLTYRTQQKHCTVVLNGQIEKIRSSTHPFSELFERVIHTFPQKSMSCEFERVSSENSSFNSCLASYPNSITRRSSGNSRKTPKWQTIYPGVCSKTKGNCSRLIECASDYRRRTMDSQAVQSGNHTSSF
jgi:hypothetical protein